MRERSYQVVMRELREDHDMGQKEVAAYLEIDQRAYSRYETGKTNMSIDKLLRLCDLYHVSADYLLGRTSEK